MIGRMAGLVRRILAGALAAGLLAAPAGTALAEAGEPSAEWTEIAPLGVLVEGNFQYELIHDGNEVRITGYNGTPTGNLTIPDTIAGKKVTQIGANAFYKKTGFTGSLRISDNVTYIGNSAFYGCSGFTGNLYIGDNVTAIGKSAFRGCNGFEGTLTIGEQVGTASDGTDYTENTNYSYAVFGGCTNFSKIINNSTVSVPMVNNFYKAGYGYLYSVLDVLVQSEDAYLGHGIWNRVKVVTGISLDHAKYSLPKGESVTLQATVTPSDAYNGDSISWKTSNAEVATVDAKGNVYGVKEGTATITATCSGFVSTCTVTVYKQVTGVSLNKTTLSLERGTSETLIATVSPADATDPSVRWGSSDANIATVDGSGKVTGLRNGTAVITVTTMDAERTATCEVTVYRTVAYQDMYRLYNPNSGEHFYTANANERDNLRYLGWTYEGIAWSAPSVSDTPVYRVYNPANGTRDGYHHYTTSYEEVKWLVSLGWQSEGIGWYSEDGEDTAIYRVFNPNATGREEPGGHHFTISASERDYLVSLGWKDEGTAWYGK